MSDTIENKAVKLSDLTSVTQLIKDYTDEKDTNKVDKIEGKSLLDDTEIERLKGVNNYDDTEVKTNIAEVKDSVANLSSQIDEIANNEVRTETLNNAVKTYINTAIDDGKMANLTIADKSINASEKIADGTITESLLSEDIIFGVEEEISGTEIFCEDIEGLAKITSENNGNVFYLKSNNWLYLNVKEYSNAGITLSIDENGVITLNGTATDNVSITVSGNLNFLKGAKYSLKLNRNEDVYYNKIKLSFLMDDYSTKSEFYFVRNSPDIVGGVVQEECTGIINPQNKNIIKLSFYIMKGTNFDNFKFELQVNSGDKLLEYQKAYEVNKYSISTTDPLEINNAKYIYSDVNISVKYKKNLSEMFDKVNSNIDLLKETQSEESTQIINNNERISSLEEITSSLSNSFYNKVVKEKHKLPYTDKSIISEQVLGETSSTLANNYPAVVNGEINSIFRYDCPKMTKGSVFPREDYVFQNTLTKYGYSVEFYADCTSIEVRVLNETTRMLLVVDGVICTDLVRISDSNNAIRFNKFTFSEKKKRHFKIGLYEGFGGICTDGEITPVTEKRPFMICEGDSLVYGVSSSVAYNKITSIFANVSQALGWDFHNDGVGSTGYVATGSGVEGTDFIGRLPEIQELQPDIFICMGGLNDRNAEIKDSSEGTTILKDAINLYWKTVKETLKTKYIIGISPFCPQITPKGLSHLEDIAEYVRLACLKNAIPYIDTIHRKVYDAFGNVLMDSSYLGNIITSANIDTYIMDDNTHLTIEGDIYLGLFLTQCLHLILNDKYGICLDETYKPLI